MSLMNRSVNDPAKLKNCIFGCRIVLLLYKIFLFSVTVKPVADSAIQFRKRLSVTSEQEVIVPRPCFRLMTYITKQESRYMSFTSKYLSNHQQQHYSFINITLFEPQSFNPFLQKGSRCLFRQDLHACTCVLCSSFTHLLFKI